VLSSEQTWSSQSGMQIEQSIALGCSIICFQHLYASISFLFNGLYAHWFSIERTMDEDFIIITLVIFSWANSLKITTIYRCISSWCKFEASWGLTYRGIVLFAFKRWWWPGDWLQSVWQWRLHRFKHYSVSSTPRYPLLELNVFQEMGWYLMFSVVIRWNLIH
jgi:hypothetical protein